MARDIKKIDAKGRLFVPTRQRDTFGDTVVVTNSLDRGYLCVYTEARFDRIKEDTKSWNAVDAKTRVIKRAILGEALYTKIDSQGRIAVSNELWEKIGAKPGDANHLQNAAISLHPRSGKAIDDALAAGASHAFVSGSGPSVIAFTPTPAIRQAVIETWKRNASVDRIIAANAPAVPSVSVTVTRYSETAFRSEGTTQ